MSKLVTYSATACKIYSHPAVNGKWTTAWLRRAYPAHIKVPNDPATIDLFFYKMLQKFVMDCPAYNYIFVASTAACAAFAMMTRHAFFNPDVTLRRQEKRKPFPDRFRQWTYSLPYFNHQLRNRSCKYRWTLIDNEPEWIDDHPAGYRPNRHPSHKRAPWTLAFTTTRYRCDDPYHKTLSHENMTRIYKEMGYQTKTNADICEEQYD